MNDFFHACERDPDAAIDLVSEIHDLNVFEEEPNYAFTFTPLMLACFYNHVDVALACLDVRVCSWLILRTALQKF